MLRVALSVKRSNTKPSPAFHMKPASSPRPALSTLTTEPSKSLVLVVPEAKAKSERTPERKKSHSLSLYSIAMLKPGNMII